MSADLTVEEVGGQLRLVTEAKTGSSLRTTAMPAFLIDGLTHHVCLSRAASKGSQKAITTLESG